MQPRRLAAEPVRRRLCLSLLAATALHLGLFAAISVFVHRADVPLAVSEPVISMVLTPAAEPEAPPQPETQAAPEPPNPPADLRQPTEPPPDSPPESPAIEPPPAPIAEPPPAPEPPSAPEPVPLPEPPTPAEPPPAPKPVKRIRPTPPSHVAAAPPPARPAPAAAPSIAPAPPAAEAPIAVDWQRSLAAWLAEHKTYPELARRQGAQGGVLLRFTADRSGHVLDVELVRGAGSPILDRAAEAMLRDATIPPFSAAMRQDKITITVQIRYTLTN